MTLEEWNMEDAIAYAREEGMEKGRFEEKLEIARSLLAEGAQIELIQKTTGLKGEELEKLLAARDL